MISLVFIVANDIPDIVFVRCDLSSNGLLLPKLIRTPGCLGLRDAVFGEVVIWQIPIAPISGYSMLKLKARGAMDERTTVCLVGNP
jgi:hypothetical protein